MILVCTIFNFLANDLLLSLLIIYALKLLKLFDYIYEYEQINVLNYNSELGILVKLILQLLLFFFLFMNIFRK